MKIALVHDYIKEYGGAESVLEELSDIYPEAQIFTSLYCPKFLGPHQNRLQNKWKNRVNQSFFQYIPFAYKIISPLRLLSPLAFKQFDFSKYDLIISSATGAYFPNSLNKKSAKLICYCHTPPRYLYGLPTARNFTNNKFIKSLAFFVNHWLRLLDFKFAQNVDQFIANSSTTALRIKKFYRRDSVVINPPVDISTITPAYQRTSVPDSFYLTGGRLARAKRYDIAILACNKLHLPLKIFGRDFASYQDELKSISGKNIEFLGEISQIEKQKLLSQAKAFIFCSDNEDFGIAPVEAMAAGTPVVGYRSGGTTETVIDGKTGILFDELTVTSCADAILKFNKTKINSQDCLIQSQKFSKQIFINKINKLTSDI